MRNRSAIGAALALAVALPAAMDSGPAAGQGAQCADRAAILAALAARHGERPLLSLITRGGGRLDIVGNPDGSTWTFVLSAGDAACVMDFGPAWRPAPPEVAKGPGA